MIVLIEIEIYIQILVIIIFLYLLIINLYFYVRGFQCFLNETVYLTGYSKFTHAHCYHLTRSIAFVRATAYQDAEDVPIASATAMFMLGANRTDMLRQKPKVTFETPPPLEAPAVRGEIIRFRTLTEDDLGHIVGMQVDKLRERMAARRITLLITTDALAHLAHEGYDPVFGARPLKRVIQRAVGDRLATTILEGRAGDGDTITVEVGHSEGSEPAALQISVNGASEATPSK